MSSSAQITANQMNSLQSTGPVSTGGKKRSSLNALKHGFTGQTLVVSESEAPLYNAHCRDYHAEMRPKGKIESDLVQEMADLRWAINRIRAQETNMFSLSAVSEELTVESGDAEVNSALAAAAALAENVKTLATLSLYEQRKLRAFDKADKRLRELQAERRQTEKVESPAAANIPATIETKDENPTPDEIGFVYSNDQLAFQSDIEDSENRGNHVQQIIHLQRVY
jgi:hypothetical protein